MFKMTAHLSYGVQEYVCDAYEDLEELAKLCDLGDKCYIISENALYMIDSNKQWHKVGYAASSAVSSSTLGIAIIGEMMLGE